MLNWMDMKCVFTFCSSIRGVCVCEASPACDESDRSGNRPARCEADRMNSSRDFCGLHTHTHIDGQR